ncbi:MAG: GTPase HflX [Chloroflexi bacterium]|nr:GTPase HflX [Chloroflexota bacterium]MYI03790.1 GTPase HflX [Chloroflexota bacterium]
MRNRRPKSGRRRRHPTHPPRERAILIGVDFRRAAHWSIDASLEELSQLAVTAGAMPLARVKQRLRHPDPNSYVGKGKLEQIVEMRDELRATVAIFDDELTPAQQRTLEQRLGIKVIDRTALILDIFAQRARTREGVVQVALAQHEYLLPRLTGQWEHLERMEGAIGSRGPGETQLETDRRLIRNQIKRLKKDLERVRTHRQQHRNKRDRAGIPLVALVGYTNAGKSTLMNALTDANVRARDRLFETLDPTTRRCRLSEEHTVLLSDTVGFIQKLPTQLVAAFRATLEELEEADLLLHVVDGTSPDVLEQIESVEGTLRDLGVDQRPTLTVMNKIDALEDPVEEVLDELTAELDVRPIAVSAQEKRNLDDVRAAIERLIPSLEGVHIIHRRTDHAAAAS